MGDVGGRIFGHSIDRVFTQSSKPVGSHIGFSEKDIQTRKALAWRALHSMKRVWRSSMHAELKKKAICHNCGSYTSV